MSGQLPASTSSHSLVLHINTLRQRAEVFTSPLQRFSSTLSSFLQLKPHKPVDAPSLKGSGVKSLCSLSLSVVHLTDCLSLAAGQTVVSERRGAVVTVAINRPEVRNAVNQETARRLLEELQAFDSDPDLNVAVLHGKGRRCQLLHAASAY